MKFVDLHSEKREDLNKTGVYLITIVNKPDWYYIGSAAKTNKKNYNDIGFLQRWRNHFSTLKRNIHFNPILQRSVNKYGIENLKFKILEICNPEKCIEVEQKWLQYYIQNYNVYNINKIHPTKLGYVTSEETKLKISKSRNKKKVYQFDFNGNLIKEWECYNQILKEFPKGRNGIWRCLKNLQQTSIGYIWNYENKFEFKPFNKSKKVYQFSLDGTFIKVWLNAKEAEKTLNIHSINLCCRNKREKAGNFKWSFNMDVNIFINKRNWKKRKPILQYNLDENFIKEWDSISVAAKTLNLSTTNISNCCKNKLHCKRVGGYIWKYKNE